MFVSFLINVFLCHTLTSCMGSCQGTYFKSTNQWWAF